MGTYAPPPAPIAVSEAEMMAFDESEIAAFDHAGAGPTPWHGDS